jgi:predicted AlkP superfamily phosphohydrolase/phosphomutase
VGPRLIVLGWDSATFDVIDPLIEAGRLPALAALTKEGVRADLRSTWPPMTDCAWTSAFTGRNPGAHGIFGSWYRAPGAYAPRYFSSRDRRVPAVWEVTENVRWLVWNVPMSYPPSAVPGAMVAGYGAPPGSRFCEPDSLQDELGSRWPLDDLLDRAPHGSLESFLDDLLRGLRIQAEALPWAIRATGADAVVAVWPHVDRAQHFFWRFRGRAHHLSGAVDRVYEAMDNATGVLLSEFGEADFLVVSDHGAGQLIGDVNVGELLVRLGYAARGRGRKPTITELAWKFPPSVRRLGRRLAPGAARRAFGATLAGQLGNFDWQRTSAFVGWHGDLWLNLEGREPAGTVGPSEAERVAEGLCKELLELRDPDTGGAPFAAVHRREEIYRGPAIDLAPDLMLDSWSSGYRVSPSREASSTLVARPSPLAGVDEAWSSDHRPLGILAATGPRVRRAEPDELSLYDIGPTMLALIEEPVPGELDGRARPELLSDDFLRRHPISTGAAAAERAVGGEYSDAEAAAVASHLKDLGYIE